MTFIARFLIATLVWLQVGFRIDFAEAANRFLTCATTCTITAIDTTIWGAASGGVGATVPGSGDAVILDAGTCVGGVTCTATMGAGYNPTWQSITMGTCTASTAGCILDLSVNNNNVTLTPGVFSPGASGSTGTRTLKCGSGTFTITASNAILWDVSSATNLTLQCSSATIIFNAGNISTQTFSSAGAQTYGTFQVTGRTNGSVVSILGGSTFSAITMNGQGNIIFPAATTVGTLNIQGTSTSSPVYFAAASASATATITVTSSGTISNAGLARIVIATTAVNATSSFDFGGNSIGGIISPPTGGGGRCIGC